MVIFQAHLVNMLDSMFVASAVDEDWMDTFSIGVCTLPIECDHSLMDPFHRTM